MKALSLTDEDVTTLTGFIPKTTLKRETLSSRTVYQKFNTMYHLKRSQMRIFVINVKVSLEFWKK